jgi:hypothetical protein
LRPREVQGLNRPGRYWDSGKDFKGFFADNHLFLDFDRQSSYRIENHGDFLRADVEAGMRRSS